MHQFIVLITAFTLYSVFGATKYPESDPKNTLKWSPYWPMWDEFNENTINTKKWVVKGPENGEQFWWPGRQPGLVDENNVKQKNGRLYLYTGINNNMPLKYREKNYSTFTVSLIHSKAALKYGYSEIKAKVGTSRISSSYWFYGKDETAATEIDVFEQSGSLNSLNRNYYHKLHANRYIHRLKGFTRNQLPAKCNCAYGNGSKCHDTPVGNTWSSPDIDSFSDDWHIYGMWWTSTKIRIYVDGNLRITMNNDCNKYPLWLVFNRATMPKWFKIPPKADIPDQPFQIEYVRTWRRGGSSAYNEQNGDGYNHIISTTEWVVIISSFVIILCICIGIIIYIQKRSKKQAKVAFEVDEEAKEENEEEQEIEVDVGVETDGKEMDTKTNTNSLALVADDSD